MRILCSIIYLIYLDLSCEYSSMSSCNTCTYRWKFKCRTANTKKTKIIANRVLSKFWKIYTPNHSEWLHVYFRLAINLCNARTNRYYIMNVGQFSGNRLSVDLRKPINAHIHACNTVRIQKCTLAYTHESYINRRTIYLTSPHGWPVAIVFARRLVCVWHAYNIFMRRGRRRREHDRKRNIIMCIHSVLCLHRNRSETRRNR